LNVAQGTGLSSTANSKTFSMNYKGAINEQ